MKLALEGSKGCPRGPEGPRAPGLRSVQKVSRECPQSVKKVSGTLWGHSRDTFGHSGARGPGHPLGPALSVRNGRLQSAAFSIRRFYSQGRPVAPLSGNVKFPEGPTIKKIQSRLKSAISIEIFNLARKFQSRRLDLPTKIGPWWVACSQNFILAQNFQSRSKSRIILIFVPSGQFFGEGDATKHFSVNKRGFQ